MTFIIWIWVLVAGRAVCPTNGGRNADALLPPAAFPHRGIRIFLTRGDWLDSWILTVELEATRRIFDLDAIRGSLAKWTTSWSSWTTRRWLWR